MTQLSLDLLVDGAHEKCAWCRAPFVWTDGAWQRWKALDGRYYCSEEHGSAPYLTPRTKVRFVHA